MFSVVEQKKEHRENKRIKLQSVSNPGTPMIKIKYKMGTVRCSAICPASGNRHCSAVKTHRTVRGERVRLAEGVFQRSLTTAAGMASLRKHSHVTRGPSEPQPLPTIHDSPSSVKKVTATAVVVIASLLYTAASNEYV